MIRPVLLSALLLIGCNGTDPTGDSGTDSDSTTTTEDVAPEIAITSPGDGDSFSLAEEVTLSGTASDEDDVATELAYSWSSSLDGELADLAGSPDEDGNFTGSTTALTAGDHTLSLTVSDPVGNSVTESVTITVDPANVAPSCAITAPVDGDSVAEGVEVAFSATVSDTEDAADAMSASLDSDIDGVFWSGNAEADGTISTSISSLTLATHTITLTVIDGAGASCTDSVGFIVGGPPELEILAPADGEEINESEWYSFTAVASDAETPLNELVVAWSSDLDGEFTSSTANAAGNVSPSYGGLSPGAHVITATVTDNEGLTATDTVTLNINGLPTAPEVVIDPDPATADEDLFAVVVTDSTDPEGDTITYSYEWYRYAIQDTDETTDAFPASKTGRGVTFTVRVVPNDGKGDGTYGEAELTIDNGAPVIGTIAIDPDPPQAEDTLLCTYGGFYDPDGDGDYSSLEWFINGGSAGSAVNLRGGFVKGDTIGCTATPSDGIDDGDPVSIDVVVVNTAPVVDEVSITPDPAYSDDILDCATVGYYDADGDADVSTYEWFINGTSVATTVKLTSGFVKGDEVTCEVTPDDGEETGTVVSSSITIQNALPGVSAVTITPDPAQTADELTCSYSGFSDADGDSDQSTYSWTVNGNEVGTSSSLSGVFVHTDTVVCTVTPSDGEDEGTALSQTLVVSNTAPTVSGVSIDPNPADVDSTLTCLYTFSDEDGEADASSITWLVDGTPSGSGPSLSGSLVQGQTVACSVTAHDGTDSGNSESASVTITNGIPSIDVVSITPVLPTVGDTLTCAYSGFYDADGDADLSTLAWAINGVPVVDGTSADLAETFSSGDLVTCTVTPDDGTDQGESVSLTVVIDDQAPTIADASLTPDPATSNETLTCIPGTTTDPDGTTDFTYIYAWEVNGVTTSDSEETLAGVFGEGDNVNCNVTPNDGQQDGNTVGSQVVTIINGTPEVTSASLSPEDPGVEDTVTVTATTLDPDGDSLALTYTWYLDGEAGPEEWSSSASLDLTGYATKGMEIYAEVVADDGKDESSALVTNTITVGNTPPTAPELSISPSTPGESVHDFQCVIDTDSTDADGDSVTYTFSWEVDGVPYTSASTSDQAGDTILAGEAFEGEEWICSVIPDDGEEDGEIGEASAVIGPECGEISSVDTPTNHSSIGSTYGQWFTDPLQTLGEQVWYMNGYNGNTIDEYDSLEDFENGNKADNWSLTYNYDGTGAVAYNGYLYYNQGGTRNMVKYDLDSRSVVDTVELTDAGYRNTYHYQWGGYSDIDFAVDENGLWVLYSTKGNTGRLVASKLSEDLEIEDTWNTASETKSQMGNAFVICGIVYAIDSYSGSSTNINYAYDTSDSSDWSESISFTNPGGYNSMVDYNYLDQELWAWDNSRHLTYEITF